MRNSQNYAKFFKKMSEYIWEMPAGQFSFMRVPARIFATKSMLNAISRDDSLRQLINVTSLPGIVGRVLAMPDAHEGYGFPIGGVAATDAESGVISPGGIGYDINCGVRLLVSSVGAEEVKKRDHALLKKLLDGVPSGVGKGGELHLSDDEICRVLEQGAKWAIARGYGSKEDLSHIESGGCMTSASAESVSKKARSRGRDQLGTLGAGNHFLDVACVEEVYDEEVAQSWGISKGMTALMVHTGSRGLGHQVATDSVSLMMSAMSRYGISVPDRELACVPFSSEDGQRYFSAMSAAANFAWANRQIISELARRVWEDVFGPREGNFKVLYDIAHNVAKVEEHDVDGAQKRLVVHRKGATRCFPGEPVIIPGSMGTASYVLVGEKKALTETFGSSCHGAGRSMSRSQALRTVREDELKQRLDAKGILVDSKSYGSLAEEAPEAYKDVDEVVGVVEKVGLARRVARLTPMVVVKG